MGRRPRVGRRDTVADDNYNTNSECHTVTIYAADPAIHVGAFANHDTALGDAFLDAYADCYADCYADPDLYSDAAAVGGAGVGAED